MQNNFFFVAIVILIVTLYSHCVAEVKNQVPYFNPMISNVDKQDLDLQYQKEMNLIFDNLKSDVFFKAVVKHQSSIFKNWLTMYDDVFLIENCKMQYLKLDPINGNCRIFLKKYALLNQKTQFEDVSIEPEQRKYFKSIEEPLFLSRISYWYLLQLYLRAQQNDWNNFNETFEELIFLSFNQSYEPILQSLVVINQHFIIPNNVKDILSITLDQTLQNTLKIWDIYSINASKNRQRILWNKREAFKIIAFKIVLLCELDKSSEILTSALKQQLDTHNISLKIKTLLKNNEICTEYRLYDYKELKDVFIITINPKSENNKISFDVIRNELPAKRCEISGS